MVRERMDERGREEPVVGWPCPDCRDNGRHRVLEIVDVVHGARSVSTGVTFRCPQCAWSERYEL